MVRSGLGEFEVAVLLSVARLGEDAYGSRVRHDVSLTCNRDYSVGAIYMTLQRLEDKRFLESWMSDPIPVRGGRSRRHYRITAAGERALSEARLAAARLWGCFDVGMGPI